MTTTSPAPWERSSDHLAESGNNPWPARAVLPGHLLCLYRKGTTSVDILHPPAPELVVRITEDTGGPNLARLSVYSVFPGGTARHPETMTLPRAAVGRRFAQYEIVDLGHFQRPARIYSLETDSLVLRARVIRANLLRRALPTTAAGTLQAPGHQATRSSTVAAETKLMKTLRSQGSPVPGAELIFNLAGRIHHARHRPVQDPSLEVHVAKLLEAYAWNRDRVLREPEVNLDDDHPWQVALTDAMTAHGGIAAGPVVQLRFLQMAGVSFIEGHDDSSPAGRVAVTLAGLHGNNASHLRALFVYTLQNATATRFLNKMQDQILAAKPSELIGREDPEAVLGQLLVGTAGRPGILRAEAAIELGERASARTMGAAQWYGSPPRRATIENIIRVAVFTELDEGSELRASIDEAFAAFADGDGELVEQIYRESLGQAVRELSGETGRPSGAPGAEPG